MAQWPMVLKYTNYLYATIGLQHAYICTVHVNSAWAHQYTLMAWESQAFQTAVLPYRGARAPILGVLRPKRRSAVSGS